MSVRIVVSVTEIADMNPNDRYVVEGIALSTAAEDVGEIQGHDNDTNPLQLLSHLDPPVDSVYMICGVLIAMVLVGVIIVLLAVTIRARVGTVRILLNAVANVATTPGSLGAGHRRLLIGGHRENVDVAKKISTLARLYLKCRKMVGSNGTMIAIRLVRSKLRKREDHHSNAVHPESAVVQTATTPVSTIVQPSHAVEGCCTQMSTNTTVSTDLGGCNNNNGSTNGQETGDNLYGTTNTGNQTADQFVWQFPPPYPPPHTPTPQYALYNDQDTLVHTLPSDRPGFAKGFRKNIGGRWRRLVKRKPETETCAIPPELKDQLKTIYVY